LTNQIRHRNRILRPASGHEMYRQISKRFAHFFYFCICFFYIFSQCVVSCCFAIIFWL
jgi:hypothetical protein